MNTRTNLILAISLVIPLASGCTQAQAPATSQSYPATQSQPATEFSQAQLDSLLAPIALYPDTVLSHVLIASTYPLEVVQADRWMRNRTQLVGDDAIKAVENQDWDPSIKALVAFPDILRRMSENLDWTQQLGDAFLADESRVMDTIQNLRNKAYASGNLDKNNHIKVVREERVIMIEPTYSHVVYVPVYDTRVVYGSWWWPDYPPVYWHHPHGYSFVSGFYWGPRAYLTSNSRFFFSGCHWSHRRVVVIDRHHHHHHHPHKFNSNRAIVHYRESRHWHHNPIHRRGVAYYDNRTRERFNSPRESYRDSRVYRTNYANPNARPNQARDERQHGANRPDNHDRNRFQRDQQPSRETRIVGGGRVENGRQPQFTDRAQELRERMNNRRDTPTPRTEDRWSNRDERNNQVDRTRNTQPDWRGNDQHTPQATHRTETPRQEPRETNQPGRLERIREQPTREYSRPSQERAAPERTRPSYERTERPQRIERPQRDEGGGRSFRTERQDSGRQREDRPIRGGREM